MEAGLTRTQQVGALLLLATLLAIVIVRSC
jgi:hypothetical protein